jgi:hypothetical protein
MKACKLYACKDEKTGRIVLRPEGCKPGEVAEFIKEVAEQGGVDFDLTTKPASPKKS